MLINVYFLFRYILPPSKVGSRGTLFKLKTDKAWVTPLVDRVELHGPGSQKHVRDKCGCRPGKMRSNVVQGDENQN